MPRWIYGNPPDSAHESEQHVAQLLQNLPDGFWIRWGFSYTDPSSGILREGDFVVQGPDGHLLVLEVKGGRPTCDPATGCWNTGESPFDQLDAEWAGTRRLLEAHTGQVGVAMPFVDRALGLPEVELAPDQTTFEAAPRAAIASAGDLRNFSAWWKKRFAHRHLHPRLDQARQLFDGVFASGVPAGATGYTLDFADRVIERQTQCHFEILDALADNRQLLFSGGPGTGKTWLALEQAARWAASDMDVLFLCYNLELEAWLRIVAPKKQKRIYVYSYQSLASKILGRPLRQPDNPVEASRYFDAELPLELARAVSAPGFALKFDALVVDEAQDHNTAPAIDGLAGTAVWWSLYLALLQTGYEAPVAVFHDQAQRLSLRAGRFEPSELANVLSNPVGVRLRHPVRYTRQLRDYFRTLICEHTSELLRDMTGSSKLLPEGPAPELIPDTPEHEEGRRCAEVIRRWIERGEARPHDIMVLFPSSKRVPAWLEQGRVDGVSFHLGSVKVPPEAVAAVSINKAKGLERRAVVVVGLPDWTEAAADAYRGPTFLQGVTRAQQLLAVVTRPRENVSP